MKKSLKLAVPVAAVAALLSLSAFAETRHQDETWRNGNQRNEERRDRNDRYDNQNNREFLRGVVERIDNRRDVVVLREARSGRRITVDMDRLDQRDRNRRDLSDLRRGNVVTLAGEWRRGGTFEAFRITDIDAGRRW